MKWIRLSIQGGWLRRTGVRARWATVYVHRYDGRESTERMHSHPWAASLGVVLRGTLTEVVGHRSSAPRTRGPLSVRFYGLRTEHRVESGEATTLFVGFLRTQQRIPRAAEVRAPEGYCHYTEIGPLEEGFRADLVAPVRVRGD